MADSEGLTGSRELVERAEARRAEHQPRLHAYERYERAYFGNDPVQPYGAAALNNYADGRPALRAPGENEPGKNHRAAPNYIKPIVKDMVAIRGVWPTVTVPPASAQPGDRDSSVRTTRALRQQHEQSAMVRKQQRAGWFLACLGDVCYTLDPRTPDMERDDPDPFRPAGVYFDVVHPAEAFPHFRGDELIDLFIIRRISRSEAREAFPGVALDGDPTARIDVIHYYSKSERQTLVDGRRATGVRHSLGFCPAEWASTEATDGHWAQGDIAGCVDLHEEVQDLWKVHEDSILFAVYPIIHVHEPELGQGQVTFGPGAQYTSRGAGKIELLAPQANPQSSALIFDGALDNLMKQSGVSPIRIEGQIDRSNVSARSVDRQQAPMEQRLKLSMALLGQTLQRLNSKCLLMLSNIDELKDAELTLYGQDREGIYRETFSGAQIGGWVRNEVAWDALTGTTSEQAGLQSLQLYKEGTMPDGSHLYPFEEVLARHRYPDPRAIMERARAESAEHPPAGGAPPGIPPGGAPGPGGPGGMAGSAPPPGMDDAGKQQMSLAMGGPGGPGGQAGGGPPPVQPPPGTPPNGAASAPPGVPNFPPVAAAPGSRGSPAPVPDVFGIISSALAAISLRGSADPVVRNNAIVVEVSDHRDVPAVKAALKPVEAQLGQSISVKVSTGRTT